MPIQSFVERVFIEGDVDEFIAALEITTGLLQTSGKVCMISRAFDTINDESGQILDRQEAVRLAREIDSYSTPVGQHTRVKQDADWRRFYSIRLRQLLYLTPNRRQILKPVLETGVCMACGICLPLELIEIDHQRPQVGGEVHAICKVFRTLGLTVNGPKGMKGRALLARHAGIPMIRLPRKPPKGLPIVPQVPIPIQPGTPKALRYTLTPEGNLFLSLILAAHLQEPVGNQRRPREAFEELKNTCMNHFANLKPLCAACNKAKSNIPIMDDEMIVDEYEHV